MTRGMIKAFAMANVMAYVGSETASDPISFDRKLSQRCTELENLLDAVYLLYKMNIVSGQSDYCATPLYKVDKVLIQKADDTWFDSGSPSVSDQAYGSSWLTDPQSGDPSNVVMYGLNFIRLYPVPNYNKVDGLRWWGFGTTDGTWDADTDECPLPSRMHDTLVYALSADWLNSAPIKETTTPAQFNAIQRQAAYYEGRYRYLKGHHESDAATLSEEARQHADHKTTTSSPNPLNLHPGPLNSWS